MNVKQLPSVDPELDWVIPMRCPPTRFWLRKVWPALLMLCSLSAQAQLVFNVNSTLDQVDIDLSDGICQTAAGTCTLRAAVMQANRVPGAGAMIFLPASATPYGLTRLSGFGDEDSWGDLDLSTPAVGTPVITIRGAGASLTIIDANQIDRVLDVKGSRTATISDVTIRGGLLASNSSLGGAGIHNAGSLTLMRVVITNNKYFNFSQGGGILTTGTLAVFDSTIIGNQADFGAGIWNGGFITIDRSTIAENAARLGGGLFLGGPSTIRNSLIINNSASEIGGGILVDNSPLNYLINTTISGNLSDTNGGGIYVFNGTLNIYSASVINNDADHDRDQNGGIGGGIFVKPGAVLALRNSLIANNTVLGFFDDDCKGVLTGYGRNMVSSTDGCSSNLGALSLVTGSSIGPLQNNGGPTRTHALLAGSQAIDASLAASPCQDQNAQILPTDQRGAPRVFGVRCDVGAYEFGSVLDLLFRDGFQ